MKTIGAAKFKAQCLALLDDLGPEGLIVTKRGKPVARVLPIPKRPAELIGSLKGKVKVNGDILSTGLTWDADAES
jgi:antitoxin (DNA-binding transcriptional repressor) of toxin-antitoxin stability system